MFSYEPTHTVNTSLQSALCECHTQYIYRNIQEDDDKRFYREVFEAISHICIVLHIQHG